MLLTTTTLIPENTLHQALPRWPRVHAPANAGGLATAGGLARIGESDCTSFSRWINPSAFTNPRTTSDAFGIRPMRISSLAAQLT